VTARARAALAARCGDDGARARARARGGHRVRRRRAVRGVRGARATPRAREGDVANIVDATTND
jgi:hypothetical protein